MPQIDSSIRLYLPPHTSTAPRTPMQSTMEKAPLSSVRVSQHKKVYRRFVVAIAIYDDNVNWLEPFTIDFTCDLISQYGTVQCNIVQYMMKLNIDRRTISFFVNVCSLFFYSKKKSLKINC